MNAKLKRRIKPSVAAALSAALILTSPGIMGYRAAAQALGGSAAATHAKGSGVAPITFSGMPLTGPSRASLGQVGLPQGVSLPGVRMDGVSVSKEAGGVTAGAFEIPGAPLSDMSPVTPGAVAIVDLGKTVSIPVARNTLVSPEKPLADLAGKPVAARAEIVESAPGTVLGKGIFADLWQRFTGMSKDPLQGSRKAFDGEKDGSTPMSLEPDQGAEKAARTVLKAVEGSKEAVEAKRGQEPPQTRAPPKKESSWLSRYGAPTLIAAGIVAVFHANLLTTVVISGSLVFSILLHESAHLLGLRIYGDKTPAKAGRDTLNPLHHIDPIGTILIPAVSLLVSTAVIGFPLLFGWAKPVPVDFNNLKNPKKISTAKVALMGPAANLLIAGAAGLAWMALPAAMAGGAATLVLATLFKMNLALTAFNLLPLPMLDGGKAFVGLLLPQRLYDKWITDPELPGGYQGIFKRIYEGPANLLSKIHVHSLDRVNNMTKLASFAALGAFYAVFFTALQIPLMFLVLPCSYDYWCIREKVRSEAAVKDLMEIMGEWGAVISQIAEDLGAESEVDAYEAEHAMKNALETAIDEMMRKDEFRALTEEEKVKELMRVYPEFAAKFLKDKAMTEDSLEKIMEILNDSRNQPFKDRVEKWLRDHDVFKKWGSPHQKKKLKDSMKEAEEPKKKSAGGGMGGAALPMLLIGSAIALSQIAPGLGAALAGAGIAMGMIRTKNTGKGPENKIIGLRNSNEGPGVFWVHFARGVAESDALAAVERIMPELPSTARVIRVSGDKVSVRIETADVSSAGLAAEAAAAEEGVASIAVHADVYEGIGRFVRPLTLPEADFGKISLVDGQTAGIVKVTFSEGLTRRQIIEVLARHGAAGAATLYRNVATLGTTGTVDVKPVAIALSAEAAVSDIKVPLGTDLTPIEPAPGIEKIALVGGMSVSEIQVSFAAGTTLSRIMAVLSRHDASETAVITDNDVSVVSNDSSRTTALALAIAAETDVVAVKIKDYVDPKISQTPYEETAVVYAERLKQNPFLQTLTFRVSVGEGANAEKFGAILEALGVNDAGSTGNVYTILSRDEAELKSRIDELLRLGAVTGIVVSPSALALLGLGEAAISVEPGAEDRSILVRFKEGVTEDTINEYARRRSLRITEYDYRGRDGLVLMEVAEGVDAAWVVDTLKDEFDPEGPIISTLLFKEREGGSEQTVAAQEAPAVEPPRQKPERRDVQASWLEFLNNTQLIDGRSTLTPEQVQLLNGFLRPVVAKSDSPTPPTVARTEEIKRVLPIILSPRGMRNSVVMIGEPGVGKTAVVEGVAEIFEDSHYANELTEFYGEDSKHYLELKRARGRWLVELDIDALLTEDEPVKVLNALLKLIPMLNDGDPSKGNKIILLLDEIHKLFMDQNGVKIANALKGPLRDGRISIWATITEKEFKKYIEPDGAFNRRLETVRVPEPSISQTIDMLRGAKDFLEKTHNAVIPDEALVSAAKLFDQFDKENFNPDKSFKGIQDSAELARPDNLRSAIALDIRETWRQLISAVNEARQELVDKGIASSLALPVPLYNRIAGLVETAAALYAGLGAVEDGKGRVTVDLLKKTLSKKTGITAGQLTLGEEDASRYVEMEKEIAKRVINQEGALLALANAVRRNKAGISNSDGPMAKFMLVGPTGVGKTYVAKELAEFLFHDRNAMIRMDMSEYMHDHEVSKMTGAPPGYIGHGEGGQLTEAVRKKPYSVILFDEIEKAHPKVWDILLQILDDGRLTDGEGRTIDFSNTIILLSSNVGMSDVESESYEQRLAAAGSVHERAQIEDEWDAEIALAIKEGIKRTYRPEFINRLDEDPGSKNKWITFNRLNQENIGIIAGIQLREFADRLKERHDADIEWSDEVREFLKSEGFSPQYGARPMKGAIEKNIVDPLASWILAEASKGRRSIKGSLITVSLKDGKIAFEMSQRPVSDEQRKAFAGPSEMISNKIFGLIDALTAQQIPREKGAGEVESAPEPTENLFDSYMSGADEALKAAEADLSGRAFVPRPFFNPGTASEMSQGKTTVQAAHNNPKKADPNVRTEIKRIVGSLEGQWPENVVAAVQPASGEIGAGWLKHFVKHAKEMAAKANIEESIKIESQIDEEYLRLRVHSRHELGADEIAAIKDHFTGTPPASFKDAQEKADDLNLTRSMIRDHALWDLYRRLLEIPGARVGYAAGKDALGGSGTDYWLEIPKHYGESRKIAEENAGMTPHRVRENSKTQELLLGLIVQEGLSAQEKDGTAVKIAAAAGYGALARRENLRDARAWIRDHGWSAKDASTAKVTEEWPLVLAAALVLEKFGTRADIPILEAITRKVTSGSHYHVPIHQALAHALAALYERAGMTLLRQAMERNDPKNSDIRTATLRALGRLSDSMDIKNEIEKDPEGLAALLERLAPEAVAQKLNAEWMNQGGEGDFNEKNWKSLDDEGKILLLKLVAKNGTDHRKNLAVLKSMLDGNISNARFVRYNAAEAWGEIVARENMTLRLQAALEGFLEKVNIASYNNSESYGVLLAMIYALQKAGGPENIAGLEEIMKKDPGNISSSHEQAFFETPKAWAMTVIRAGLFRDYAAPRTNEDGSPKPSIIEGMLSSNNPMFAAAAIYAIVYSQQGLGGGAGEAGPGTAPGETPDMTPKTSSNGSSSGYGYQGGFGGPYGGMYDDFGMEGFDRRGHRMGHWRHGRLPPMS